MQECVYTDRLISLSLISGSPGHKIKSAAIVAGVAKDSQMSATDATTSSFVLVTLISLELTGNDKTDLVASMLKAANQNRTAGKIDDVIRRTGTIEYSMNAQLLFMLKAKAI
jgi:phage-related baseplate assembly protein